MSQKRLVALKTAAQVSLHMDASRIGIAFNNGINDSAVLFLQMEIVILRACARCLALEIATRDNSCPDQLQEFREAPILGGFRYGEMQLEIGVSCWSSVLQALTNRSMGIEDFLNLHRRTSQRRKGGRFDFEDGPQFQQFYDGGDALCGEIVEGPLRNLLGGQGENPGAFSRLDEAVGTQDGNGFPHYRPAHGILPGQRAFAWQAIPGQKCARLKILSQCGTNHGSQRLPLLDLDLRFARHPPPMMPLLVWQV